MEKIEKLISDSSPNGYLTFYNGILSDCSYGCGCCSYSSEIDSEHQIETIDEYIKSYESCISNLKEAKKLLMLNEKSEASNG